MITAKDFQKYMRSFLPLPSDNLLVAVSGGADSLALILLLNEWSLTHAHKIIAITVDHKLRRTSTLEAAWVKKLMKKNKIEHHTLTLTPPEQKTGLPAWAREARYKAMELFGIEHEAYALFLAHHQDDQIETILMRLMKGSHWRGLSGMYPEREGKVLTYFRPLLGVRKHELIGTLQRFDITECVMDPTNDQKGQGRGFIRNVFLPGLRHRGFEDQLLFKLGCESLSVRQDEDKKVKALLDKKVNFSELGFATISVKNFTKIDPYFRSLVVAKIINYIGSPRFPLKKQAFEEMMKRMPGDGTIGNCRLFIKDDLLCIMRETRNYPKPVALKGQGMCFFQDRFLIHYDVPPKKTYKLETLGKKRFQEIMELEETLKEGVKLPDIYFTLPCVTHLDDVVSVPHLCYYRDEKHGISVEPLFHKRRVVQDQRKGRTVE